MVRGLENSQLISALTTHIQEDEIAGTPSDERLALLQTISLKKTPTSAFAFSVSRWDQAEWGTPETNKLVKDLQGESVKYLRDALIGATAATKADILVTDDGRLHGRLKHLAPQLRVMNFAEFEIFLRTIELP